MKCPNCSNDDKDLLEILDEDQRTRELVVLCNCCSKIFRIEIKNGVQKAWSR